MINVPKHWNSVSLENLIVQVIGGDWGVDPAKSEDGMQLVKVLKGTDIKHWDQNRALHSSIRSISHNSLIRRRLNIGDIILEVSGGGPEQPVGRTVIIDSQTIQAEEYPLVCSNFFRKISLTTRVNPYFIQYYLEFSYLRGEYDDIQSHTTNLRNLKVPQFLKTTIPLPGLQEQNLIASRINLIDSKLTALKRYLESIPNQIEKAKQAVIISAVTGQLTTHFREKNTSSLGAIELLEKIVSSRNRDYHTSFQLAKKNQTSKPRSPKYNFETIDTSSLHEIPSSWTWTRLLNFAEITSGVTKGRHLGSRKTVEYPYLRVANVQDGYLDLNEIKSIPILSGELEKYKLLRGDILFTEGGDRDKLGRGTVWNDEIKNCIHQNHIIRARVPQKYVDPNYISLFTKSPVAINYFYENAKQTVNLASISLSTLSNVPIAFPPIEEQREISKKANKLIQLLKRIEGRYNQVVLSFGKCRMDLFVAAFSGKLMQSNGDSPSIAELSEFALAEMTIREEEIKYSSISQSINRLKSNIMEIIEALEKNGGSMSPLDLWKSTKYADNIEDFYSALKVEFEKRNTISENEDKTLISLKNANR